MISDKPKINQFQNKLVKAIKEGRTLLGIGPMSRNCVDSVIELSRYTKAPLILIASRRQIDSSYFGGGYVNNWTTEEFSYYLKNNNLYQNILLARDHGGPWQNNKEVTNKLSLKQAMQSAKTSFETDIKSGFNIIHIDPSIDINHDIDETETFHRIIELIEFCTKISKKYNNPIIIEVGTEEQSGTVDQLNKVKFYVSQIKNICRKQNLILPQFIVVQTGTKVKEMKNTGNFSQNIDNIKNLLKYCNQEQIFIKEHNTDYLPPAILSKHPKIGIHAANVAPEFGVTETKAFIKLLTNHKLKKLSERFIKLSYESNKWIKWMIPNSSATDYDKALISGHYVFSYPEFVEIKKEAQSNLKQIIIDEYLKNMIKKSICRYLYSFNLLN